MKKATKRKNILSGILFHMILVFTACGLCNKATFIGDEISDTEFEIQINEKGTYRLCVSGKDAKGHVIFSRCKEEKDI